MPFFLQFLGGDEPKWAADWIVKSFPIIRIVLVAIMAVCAIGLIVVILLQSSTGGDNLSALKGQESYYAQNKAGTKDGRFKRLTIIFACIIFACVLLYFISCIVYPAQ